MVLMFILSVKLKVSTHWPGKQKIVNEFLSMSLNICYGCSKYLLKEMVILSTHNTCLG